MDDNYIPQKAPIQNNISPTGEDSTNKGRVFDISEDSISPVDDSNLVQAPTESPKPYIPPDADLLDKKIGTFDAVPFAPAKKESPVIPAQPPKTSTPTFNSDRQQQEQGFPRIPINPIAPLNKAIGRSPQDKIVPILPSDLPQQKPLQSITTQQEKPETETIKPIRTYEGDVAEVMAHKKTSSASIAIAESKKQAGEEKLGNDGPSHVSQKMTIVLISILLLGGGVVGAYYLYSISPLAPAAQTTSQKSVTPSIIPSDTKVVVIIDGNQGPLATQTRIQNEIAKIQASNSIKEIIPVTKNASGALTRITGPDMIHILDINVPDVLNRSIAPNWMLGVYADADDNKSLFVVVTSTFFQNTFAGMLQWESVMADDLKQYLYPTEPAGISNSSADKNTGALPYINPLDNLNAILPATASSSAATGTKVSLGNIPKAATTTKNATSSSTTPETTQPLRSYFTLRGKFEDRIVKNKDVREFRTDTGETLFLYSFIDSNHLVVTSKKATLAEILVRLEKQSFIR